MSQSHFYFLFLAALVPTFVLVYAIIAGELQSRRERRERERLGAVYSEVKRLHASESNEQWEAVEEEDWDSSDGVTLDFIKQLQQELNHHVIELEREL
jgi:hypothetical protein